VAETVWASVRGEIARFTALDNCCTPVNKACGKVTTSGFISVKLTQEIEAATVVKVKSANDQICVYDPGCDSLLDLAVEVQLCSVDPDLVTLITGQSVVLDFAGNSVGLRRSTNLNCNLRWALEVWTDVPGTACVGTPPAKQYGYFLVPCIRSATITGDITIDNANAISLTLAAKTTLPSLWNTGPQTADNSYKVVPTDIANTPGYLLTPIGSTDHDHMQVTTIAPPAVATGCVALTVTAGVPQLVRTLPQVNLAAAGGKAIELLGSYFTGATNVTFGGVAATNFVVVDDTHIEAVYPAKAAGSYPVVVTNAAGVSTQVYNVTYV
jgi:hypothetical protein